MPLQLCIKMWPDATSKNKMAISQHKAHARDEFQSLSRVCGEGPWVMRVYSTVQIAFILHKVGQLQGKMLQCLSVHRSSLDSNQPGVKVCRL